MAGHITNALMCETLRALWADIARVETRVDDLAGDFRSMKGPMAAFMQIEVAQDGAVASIKSRLDRIERRLEISDA